MFTIWMQKDFLFFVLWIFLLCACTAKGEIWSLSLLFIVSYTIAINLFNYQLQMNLFWWCKVEKIKTLSVHQNFHIFNSFYYIYKILLLLEFLKKPLSPLRQLDNKPTVCNSLYSSSSWRNTSWVNFLTVVISWIKNYFKHLVFKKKKMWLGTQR